MKNNKAGFTLIEMIFCISVILVILLLVIPNVTSKNNVVKGKGCEAQVEVVNSQIILYQIEHDELPTSISQLTSGSNPYLTQKQATCPNGIYQMDKLMYKKGFTVIEMLFVLSITIFLSSLCMTMHTRTINEQEEIALIKAMFDEARAMAIVEKDTVKVSVSNHRIDLIGKENKTLNLEEGYQFLTNHTFTYNDHGRIKIAKTLVLKTPHHTRKFVFQLGSGAYYVT